VPDFLKQYGDTIGPLGYPMTDAEAKSLDALLDTLPEVDYQRIAIHKAQTSLSDGERADIAWISTETLDRQRDVILSSGMDDSHFKANPIVTLNHSYWQPPVGVSVWRRKMLEGDVRGIKAKTHYPARPEAHPREEIWHPDEAFSLIQSGLMVGKSIGFLTLESHAPTDEEVRKKPALAQCRRLVTKWLLVEYACTWLPVNQDSVTEQVSKSLEALAIPLAPPPRKQPERIIPFTSEEEIQKAVERTLGNLNPTQMAQDALDRLRGRI
jgi:hypothetical protein